MSYVDLAVWADRRSDVPLGAGPELLLEGEAHRVAEDLRHATVPGWRRCSRLMTNGSMSAWLTAGPRRSPLSRPARRRSSCSRTSHQRPAGLTRHRVGDPGWPRHGHAVGLAVHRHRNGARARPARRRDHRLAPHQRATLTSLRSMRGTSQVYVRHEAQFHIPRQAGRDWRHISLDPMAYPEPKGHLGDNSMPGNQRSRPGVRGDALGDLHDTAKAGLPEA